MQYTHDRTLGGHVMQFADPSQMIEETWTAHNLKGLKIEDWDYGGELSRDKYMEVFNTIEAGAVETVEKFMDTIRSQELPEPVDRRRKRVWSDMDGEIEMDRIFRGDAEYMRKPHRTLVHSSQNIALLCNLDAAGCHNSKQVFWRGAATIALCDILESHGYNIEVWFWCLGANVYRGDNGQFTCGKIKEIGQPVNIKSLLQVFSSWFIRHAIFPSFHTCPATYRALGSPVFNLGKWQKYLDVTEGIQVLEMPAVFNEQDTIDKTVEILHNLMQ